MEFPFSEVVFKVSFDQVQKKMAEEQVYYSDFLAATLDVRKQIRKATAVGDRGSIRGPRLAKPESWNVMR